MQVIILSGTLVDSHDFTSSGMVMVGIFEIINEEWDDGKATDTKPHSDQADDSHSNPCDQASVEPNNCDELWLGCKNIITGSLSLSLSLSLSSCTKFHCILSPGVKLQVYSTSNIT